MTVIWAFAALRMDHYLRIPGGLCTLKPMTNQDHFEPSPYLTTKAAAHYLMLSPQTLEKYRVLGGGPQFRKHGRRVVYLKDDLDTWSEERARKSTSQTVAS